MRLLLLLALLSCDIPDRGDVRRASSDAIDSCREILAEQIPSIVGQVTAAALLACSNLGGDVAADVMASLGCARGDGAGMWDCRGSHLVCGSAP